MNISENISSPYVHVEQLPIIHFVMLWAMFFLAIPGLILNLTICALTFHPTVNGDYKWFIFNLSMIDSIYSISNFVHSQWMLFRNDYDGIFCKISAVLHWYCVLGALMALLPISFNRICSLRYQKLYQQISTPFGIGITLFICDIIPLMMILPYPLAFAPIIRYTSLVYSCDFDTPVNFGGTIYGGFLLVETPILFALLFYINFEILLIIRSRKKASIGVGDATRNIRLKETNNLMRATILQAVIPMLVQIPVLTTTGIFIFGGNIEVQWDTFSVFVHSINPIADGLITFLLVKPYNKAIRMKFGKTAPDIRQQSTKAHVTPLVGMTTLNEQKQLGNGPGRRMTTISYVDMPKMKLNEQKQQSDGLGRRMSTTSFMGKTQVNEQKQLRNGPGRRLTKTSLA